MSKVPFLVGGVCPCVWFSPFFFTVSKSRLILSVRCTAMVSGFASCVRLSDRLEVLVILGIFPITLHTADLGSIYLRKGERNKEAIVCERRARTVYASQQSWKRESSSKWTTHLAKDVGPWLN